MIKKSSEKIKIFIFFSDQLGYYSHPLTKYEVIRDINSSSLNKLTIIRQYRRMTVNFNFYSAR